MDKAMKEIPGSEFFNESETTGEFTNQIINNISAFVFIFDAELKVPVWINNHFQKRMGYTNVDLQSVTPERFISLFHPVSQIQLIRKLRSYEFIEGNMEKNLYELKTKDNEWIFILVCTKVCKHTTDGKVKYLMGSGVEIDRNELRNHIHKMKELDTICHKLSLIQKLSCREIEVIRLISSGLTDKEIAEEYKISIHTSKTHRKRIISKLGLKNSATLVKFAMENGLVAKSST
jgi:DNA-binding CsgD family transcriptional regulator